MILENQRGLFDIPEEISYLNCAYMGPQLGSVREIGERSIARKSRPWDVTPQDFFEDSETARGLFAELVNGDPDGVAIVPSVSYGMAIAAANIPVEAGENIVLLEDQFPSNVYPWRELAKRRDADVVTVPRPADHDWTSAVLDRIEEKTAVVTVPNCHWTDGSLLDLVRIGEAARSLGAAFVVDGIQSLGAHPFDVLEVQPDFLVASSYKWLLGPYGLGFMYVGEEFRNGEPIEHNWINRQDSEDFAALVEYKDGFQPGARRYDVGEHSNFVLLPMAIESLRQILSWGVGNISETIGEVTDLIESEAARLGIEAVPKERRARHMIGLRLGPTAPKDLAGQLSARNVFVSVRGESMRVSPHVYNTGANVKRLFAALEQIL